MLEPWHLPWLFGTGLAAGFVDSIAGSGGLITLPVLLSFGLNPQVALGTNKLQASFGSGSATWHYARAGTVSLRDCGRGFCITVLGAGLGACLVQHVRSDSLRRAIPLILIVVALFTLMKPAFGQEDRPPRLPQGCFDLLFGLGLGFYDGFFGPGTGTFWTLAYVLGLGFNLTRATGYTKVMNFGSNLSSLAFFLWAGQVLYWAGLVMGLGQFIGARIGAQMVVHRGTRFIRPIFISVVLALAIKLLLAAHRIPGG
jgi:uncharacterized membrane protein YfcA